MDFGIEPSMLVVIDLSTAEHALLAGQADVTALPADVDQQIGTQGRLDTIVAELEALNLPGNWVNVNHTYRFVLRMVTGAFRVAQRVLGILGRTEGKIFGGGRTLETQYNQLPLNLRNALVQAADEMGIDYSHLTATSTLRVILRTFGQQLPTIDIGGLQV
jgi:hypothetical protein